MQAKRWIRLPPGILVSIFLASAVQFIIWVPELSHWYVRPPVVSESKLQAARKAPQRHVLDEVARMNLLSPGLDSDQILGAAEQLMGGTFGFGGFAPAPISLPFAPEDIERGFPTRQLTVASLSIPDVLLDAYRISGREYFFQQARNIIVAFAHYESTRWVNHGFLWNDHAISARIAVLVKFWAEYRERPDFEPDVGRLVLNLVSRSALLLMKPAFYASRTDHGIMTNLALLQITAAFPELLDSAGLRTVATERFRNHLRYYIADEGVTLLHSAGYHSIALGNFSMALRLFTLNGIDIPIDWWAKYSKAVDFYSLLRRPDLTLPMFGDTKSTVEKLQPLLTAQDQNTGIAAALRERTILLHDDAFAVYPVAGHAIWWDRLQQETGVSASQTLITWSYHPGFGHKNADEGSIILWSRGQTWLTNAGYWPYGVAGREHAESWEASNAPHLLGESKHSDRVSRVRSMGQGRQVAFIDIERTSSQGYSVRRQVVRLRDAETWLVLDHSQDSAARTIATNWTFYPGISIVPMSPHGPFRVTSRESSSVLVCWLSGSSSMETELVVGREKPFAGWVVIDRTPVRSPAIVVRQPSQDSWSLATFAFSNPALNARVGAGPSMRRWTDSEHWEMTIPAPTGDISVARDGDRLRVQRKGSPNHTDLVVLTGLTPSVAETAAVRDAFRKVSQNHTQFREHFAYRVRASYLLLAAFVIQELLLFLIGIKLSRFARILRVAAWGAWVAGGTWLSGVYFQDM